MHKISIDIKPKNLKKVLSILEALKPELIESIHNNQSKIKDIKPVNSSLDKIDTASQGKLSSSKYLSKEKYKTKIQREPILEDEFLATKSSSGKYLNPREYKNRLKK